MRCVVSFPQGGCRRGCDGGGQAWATAAFDPDSARRLCCCRDRRRAFVFGGGNDLSVDVAEARSSPLTNELFHPNMQLSPIPRGFWPPLHFLDNQRSVKELTHLFRLAPPKSGMATSIWRQ